MAAPSTPYTITALIAAARNSSSSNGVGIGWYDGSAKLHVISYSTVSGAPAVFQVNKFNSVFSFNGSDFTSNANQFPQPVWVQIHDDGTNVSFAFQPGRIFLPNGFLSGQVVRFSRRDRLQLHKIVNPQGSQTLGTDLSWTQS